MARSAPRSVRHILAAPGLLLLGALLLSCEDPVAPGIPTTLEIVGGDDQAGAAGETLTEDLALRVRDAAGRPVPGVAVTFVVVSGGGSLFAGATVTDRGGVARDRWTLGTDASADHVVEARVLPGEGSALTATFTATAEAAGTADLAAVDGTDLSGPVAGSVDQPPVVRVTDPYGNPVPGVAVDWELGVGGGSIAAATTTTDADGRATVNWVLGYSLAPQFLTASLAELPSVSFTAHPTLPAGYVFEKLGGDGQSDTIEATLPVPLEVRLTAADGTPIRDAAVEWNRSQPLAYIPTAEDGIASWSWKLGQATGSEKVQAILLAAMDSVSFEATVAPGAAVRIETTPTTLTLFPRGTTADMDAVVHDRFDNPIPGAAVSWESLDPSVATVDTEGLVTAIGFGSTDIEASHSDLVLGRTVDVPGELIFSAPRTSIYGDLYVATTEGRGEVRLGYGYNPVYSNAGSEIAYQQKTMSFRYLYIADADGTDPQLVWSATGSAMIGPPSWAPDDQTLAMVTWSSESAEVVLVDRAGAIDTLTGAHVADVHAPDWHPDGTRLAVSIGDGALGVLSADGSTLDTIPNDDPALGETSPAWSPTGDRIAYVVPTDGARGNLYVMNADGSGRTLYLTQVHAGSRPTWSPDGTRVAIPVFDHFMYGDAIIIVPLDGSGEIRVAEGAQSGVDWWHPPE